MALTNLAELTSSSTLIHHEGKCYYSVPQTRVGEVVTFEIANHTFKEHSRIKSADVKAITSLRIADRKYLAIGGYNSGIYEFSENGFIRQNLTQGNLDGIDFWLPIPMTTYRDEVILLGERALQHDTHTSYNVEIIVNNGGEYSFKIYTLYHFVERIL